MTVDRVLALYLSAFIVGGVAGVFIAGGDELRAALVGVIGLVIAVVIIRTPR